MSMTCVTRRHDRLQAAAIIANRYVHTYSSLVKTKQAGVGIYLQPACALDSSSPNGASQLKAWVLATASSSCMRAQICLG